MKNKNLEKKLKNFLSFSKQYKNASITMKYLIMPIVDFVDSYLNSEKKILIKNKRKKNKKTNIIFL
tara:strand:- start:393 stop:590 length:198 start_codon:yes stop_codon:yes gene_type:complete